MIRRVGDFETRRPERPRSGWAFWFGYGVGGTLVMILGLTVWRMFIGFLFWLWPLGTWWPA